MEIKDVLKNNLSGEALANALDVVDYMVEKGLTPNKEWDTGFRFVKNDKSPCLLVLVPNRKEWFICDLPVVREPKWDSISDDLKGFILSHIKTCNVYEGNKCGCGSEPGISNKIFGKVYDNVCTSEIQLINPDSAVLDKFKEVIEWWAANIGA